MASVRAWLAAYLPGAWSGHMCQGLAMGMLGPTMPYLAAQVGVPNQQIGFIWTGRALGDCSSALVTSAVFRRFVKKPWQKLLFLVLCLLLSGCFGVLVPFVSSFELLLLVLLGAGYFIGSFNAANQSLVVYMLGPEVSPPYTQSLHAFAAAGFVISSLVVQPFFPTSTSSSLCSSEESSTEISPLFSATTSSNFSESPSILAEDTSVLGGSVVGLSWPFLIISAFHLVPVAIFVLTVMCRLVMPQFYENEKSEEAGSETVKKKGVKYPNLILFLGLFFFILSCGIEASFQSQTFTFGLCGPHHLSPKQAASLTLTLSLAFLVGRFSGIFLATRLRPRTLVIATNLGCLASAALLASTAGWSLGTLYIGTAAMGYSVAMQIGSGYSWLAEQMDLTGFRNSVTFFGGNLGWMVFPPLAGTILLSGPGGVGLYSLALGVSAAQLLVIGAMIKVSNIKKE